MLLRARLASIYCVATHKGSPTEDSPKSILTCEKLKMPVDEESIHGLLDLENPGGFVLVTQTENKT